VAYQSLNQASNAAIFRSYRRHVLLTAYLIPKSCPRAVLCASGLLASLSHLLFFSEVGIVQDSPQASSRDRFLALFAIEGS